MKTRSWACLALGFALGFVLPAYVLWTLRPKGVSSVPREVGQPAAYVAHAGIRAHDFALIVRERDVWYGLALAVQRDLRHQDSHRLTTDLKRVVDRYAGAWGDGGKALRAARIRQGGTDCAVRGDTIVYNANGFVAAISDEQKGTPEGPAELAYVTSVIVDGQRSVGWAACAAATTPTVGPTA